MIGRDRGQTTERIKVGMIGLAAILLLIGIAAVFSVTRRDRPIAVAGGAHPDVVANLVASNEAMPAPAATNEPLAELGVAPSATSDGNAAAPAPAATPAAPR